MLLLFLLQCELFLFLRSQKHTHIFRTRFFHIEYHVTYIFQSILSSKTNIQRGQLFFTKYKKLKERTYDLIKENKVIFRLLPFNGIASRTCQKSTFFASSRPPKWI